MAKKDSDRRWEKGTTDKVRMDVTADWDASIPDAEHREKQVRIRAELFLAFPWNLFESQQNSLTLTLNGGDNSSFQSNIVLH